MKLKNLTLPISLIITPVLFLYPKISHGEVVIVNPIQANQLGAVLPDIVIEEGGKETSFQEPPKNQPDNNVGVDLPIKKASTTNPTPTPTPTTTFTNEGVPVTLSINDNSPASPTKHINKITPPSFEIEDVTPTNKKVSSAPETKPVLPPTTRITEAVPTPPPFIAPANPIAPPTPIAPPSPIATTSTTTSTTLTTSTVPLPPINTATTQPPAVNNNPSQQINIPPAQTQQKIAINTPPPATSSLQGIGTGISSFKPTNIPQKINPTPVPNTQVAQNTNASATNQTSKVAQIPNQQPKATTAPAPTPIKPQSPVPSIPIIAEDSIVAEETKLVNKLTTTTPAPTPAPAAALTPSRPSVNATLPPPTKGLTYAQKVALMKKNNTNNDDPSLDALTKPDMPPMSTEKEVELVIDKLRADSLTKEAAKSSIIPNQIQTEISYDKVPLGTALRQLAEQAGFNFIEPNITEKEPPISCRFQKITPLEAFIKIAEARGFEVVTENGYTTLKRPDMEETRAYVVKKYKLKYAQPKWVIQEIANLLEIKLTVPQTTIQSYPVPSAAATTFGSAGGGGASSSSSSSSTTGGASGGGQNIGLPTAPRWTPSLPFDEPSYTGGTGKDIDKPYVFVDRSANALVVKASTTKHKLIEAYLTEADQPEPQIMIETRVVEVQLTDDLNYGIDWKGVFGTGISVTAKFGGASINSLSSLFQGGSFVLNSSQLTATLNAFQTYGKTSFVNMPRTYTRSGVPVDISSVTTQSSQGYQSQTGGSNAAIPSVINTFTTGMTIDVVPQLLENGMVDLNINPAVAEQTGSGSGSSSSTNSSNNPALPTISSRSMTASATVASGMTVMLGGLVSVSKIDVSTGIPILNKLPILGKTLFGNTTKVDKKTMLIFFVTPRVVYPEEYLKVYSGQETWKAMVHANKFDLNLDENQLPQQTTIKKAKRARDLMIPVKLSPQEIKRRKKMYQEGNLTDLQQNPQ